MFDYMNQSMRFFQGKNPIAKNVDFKAFWNKNVSKKCGHQKCLLIEEYK